MPNPLPARLFLALFLTLILAAPVCPPLHAQATHSVTILMLDGKTGKPIVPSNFLVRIDHLNAVHSEWISINDEGLGEVTVPAQTKYLSVQGAYNNSMDTYVNCDAAMQKDVHTLHWYTVADVLAKGINTPNECYKGKYAESTILTTKPGLFVFYVRKDNWHEVPEDF
jgi:hypothetical protein